MKQPTMLTPEDDKASDVCRRFECSDEARKLLADEPKGPEFVARLVSHRLYKDALRYMAYVLPARASVWWGLLCAWQVDRPAPVHAEAEAIRAALRWVQEPTEEHRRAAYHPGKAATGTPAGSLALAAFWSEGSMAPAGLPDVKPPADLHAKTVAAAVLAAVNLGNPKKRDERARQFLTWAEGVRQGKIRWE